MKSILAVSVGALAAVVAAQEGLSECAGVCQTNMQGLYSDLGCGDQPEGNERDTCLCQAQDWSYGIIDCSRAACSAEEANQLINWAVQRCSELGIQLSIEGDSVTTSDATATVTGGDDTASVTTTVTSSVSGVGEGTIPSPSPTDEAPPPGGVVTVISSDGEVITSTIAGEGVPTETVTSSVPEDTATETATETTSVTTGTEDGSTETTGGDDAEATDAEGGDDDSAAVVPAATLSGLLVVVGVAVVLL